MTEKNKLISIITPCFNSSNYIERTFLSIVKQTYADWEWIIVDDCSTDNSVAKIKEFSEQKSNIKLIELPENHGSAFARNEGLRVAEGTFITFLDSDDIIDPNYLEEQFNFITKNGPIITSGYRRITEKSNSIFIPRKQIRYSDLLKGNDASCLTTMYDRTIIGDVFFDTSLKIHEDYLFWLSILNRGFTMVGNQKVLASYMIRTNSKNGGKKRKLIKPLFAIYHQKLGFSRVKSWFYVFKYVIYAIKKNRGIKY